MNSFRKNQEVERRSLEILRPFIKRRSFEGQYVLIEKGRLAAELQQSYGDVFMNGHNGALCAVEIKAEKENKYQNLFLEIWSNRSRFNPGWLYKLDADVLLYHFINNDELYAMSFLELRKWVFFHKPHQIPNLYNYPPKLQSKHEQLNDTWGACVPIKDLEFSLDSFKRFKASTGEPIKAVNQLSPEAFSLEAQST